MGRIVVFGAGGRAGRAVVREAAARGHEVTAVVRDPAAHPDLPGLADGPGRVTVVQGDVTHAGSVAAVAAGHDAAISAAGRLDVPAREFFTEAAGALLRGAAEAGVPRLLLIGIGTTLEAAPGVPLYTTPGFPSEAQEFSLGHAAELDVLRAAETDVDWVVLAPPPVFLDTEAPRTGRHRVGGSALLPDPDGGAEKFPYADVAAALVDEIEAPTRHRELAAVGY